MIILYILGGILLLLLLLLSVPVFCSFSFKESLNFTLRYGFVDLTGLVTPKPEGEKSSKEKKKGKKKKSKAEEDTEEKKPKNTFLKDAISANGVAGFLGIIKSLLVIIAKRVAAILRAIHLTDCDIYMCVGGDDAASIAETYGKMCAAIYPAVQVILPFFHCKKSRTTVDLNYKSTESTVIAEGRLYVLPIAIIFEALCLIVKSIPYILKLTKK